MMHPAKVNINDKTTTDTCMYLHMMEGLKTKLGEQSMYDSRTSDLTPSEVDQSLSSSEAEDSFYTAGQATPKSFADKVDQSVCSSENEDSFFTIGQATPKTFADKVDQSVCSSESDDSFYTMGQVAKEMPYEEPGLYLESSSGYSHFGYSGVARPMTPVGRDVGGWPSSSVAHHDPRTGPMFPGMAADALNREAEYGMPWFEGDLRPGTWSDAFYRSGFKANLTNRAPNFDLSPQLMTHHHPDDWYMYKKTAYMGTSGEVCAGDRHLACQWPGSVVAPGRSELQRTLAAHLPPPPGLAPFEDQAPPKQQRPQQRPVFKQAAAPFPAAAPAAIVPRGRPRPADQVSDSGSRGDQGKQVLLVCMDAVSNLDRMQELSQDYRHKKYFHFQNAVKFTRWLFEQHRGTLRPWSILVAGWREAKPCMVALEAAFHGDISKVRPDARRAALRKPTGGKSADRKPVKIAVAAMVIVLEAPDQQLERAQSWVASVQGLIPSLDIRVVCDSGVELSETLADLRSEHPAPRAEAMVAPQAWEPADVNEAWVPAAVNEVFPNFPGALAEGCQGHAKERGVIRMSF